LTVESKDNACPRAVTHRHTNSDTSHTDVVAIARLNTGQRGRSWSLPVPEDAARVPAVGVKQWLRALPELVDTTAGRAAAARHGTGVTAVLECAPALARYADGLTGRAITASIATMAKAAGCTPKVMARARYVLRDLGLAAEMAAGRKLSRIEQAAARAHHGGYQPNAASVWHLTLPRSAGRGDLSLRTKVLNVRAVGNNSPKRACARGRTGQSTKTSKTRAGTPRPLHLQKAAAELVAACHGMNVGQWAQYGPRRYLRLPGWHIGRIAEVLVAAGVDTTVWTGRAIARRLTEHTVARGLRWPDHLHNPVGFLRSVISGVDWSTPPRRPPAAVPTMEPVVVSVVARPESPARRAAMQAAKAIGLAAAEKRRLRTRWT